MVLVLAGVSTTPISAQGHESFTTRPAGHLHAQPRRAPLALVHGSARASVQYCLAMAAKQTIRALLRSRGIEVSRYQRSVAARRQEIFTHCGIDVLVDIGANVGQYAQAVRASGYKGRIISIEPTSAAYKVLRVAAARDPLWDHEHVAVGDRAGTMKLFLSEGSIFNSLLPVDASTVKASSEARVVGTEEVPVRLLDDILGDLLEGPAAIAIKADVQGYERQVLDGASMALTHARVVELEMSPRPAYEGQMLLEEALQRMNAAGLILSLVENVLPEPGTGRALQFNGIFTRD